ncbi:hypothetical protein ABW21_db0201858 [Orbilia brochopaga]|nr:hypothetical protein ABW21_db0201858 [Drechslerella brochopaga]
MLNQGGMNLNQGGMYQSQGTRENPINLENTNVNAPSFRTAQNIFQSFNQGSNRGITPSVNQGMNSGNMNSNSNSPQLQQPGLRRSGTNNNPTQSTYSNRTPLAMTGLNIQRTEANPFSLNMGNAQRGSYRPNNYQSILDQIPRVGTAQNTGYRYFGQPSSRIQPLPGQNRQPPIGTQSNVNRSGPRQGYVDYSRVNTNNLTPEQISELFSRMEEQQARLSSLRTSQSHTQTQPQQNFLSTTIQPGDTFTSMAEEGINQEYQTATTGMGPTTGTQMIDLIEESSSQIVNSANNPLVLDVSTSGSSEEAQPGTPTSQQSYE